MSFKAGFGAGLAIFVLSIALAITFHIVQGAHQGCWTGDETTNYPLPDDSGYVLCCNDVDINTCAGNAITCLLNHSGELCKSTMCISCIILYVIAAVALIAAIVCGVKMRKEGSHQNQGVYATIQ